MCEWIIIVFVLLRLLYYKVIYWIGLDCLDGKDYV